MRIRTIVLLLIAVVLAGGTAYLARLYLTQTKQAEVQATPPPAPAKSVLVARNDVARGQILRPEDLSWQVWPEGSIDKNYVVQGGADKPETFTGWVARDPIKGGWPVTRAGIIAPGDRGFLAAVLRPGMRAISVPVTVTSGISGFIFPGDRVDLLMTFSVPLAASTSDEHQTNTSYTHKATETVLHNIRVVAIDQHLESKAGTAVPAHTATFEVTPKQSEVISLASEIGKVSLTLRSLTPGAKEPQTAEETPTSGVSAGAGPAEGESPIAAKATYTLDSEISQLLPRASGTDGESQNASVTILRGSQKTNEAAGLSKLFGAISDVTKPGG